MKNIKYIILSTALLVSVVGCEQEMTDLKPGPTGGTERPACPPGATAGSADFTKYIAIGNSITAGFQSGALFTSGQQNSLGAILAEKFACVGGGAFNQPDINSPNGFFIGGPNPVNNVVLGRLQLKGNPPLPTPTVSDAGAIPNPILNPGFMYTGDKSKLNNFAVPGITLLHLVMEETGEWASSAHPLFNPFYARFASDNGAGNTTILADATTALANGGTFFSFWVGNNDVLGYAIGGASNPAILTPVNADPNTGHPGFTNLFNLAIGTLLQVPNVEGVVGNIPDVTRIPYFKLIAYNAIPLPKANVDALNAGFAGFNQVLDGLKGAPFNLPAAEMDSRKITFISNPDEPTKPTNNRIVINDETARDLKPYLDAMLGNQIINQAQYDALINYRFARQTTPEDLVTLPAATVLGTVVNNNPALINGLTVPLGDQYILLPAEQTEIRDRTAAFNAVISNTVTNNPRLALADVAAASNALFNAGAAVVDGVTVTPTMPPPTGLFSEDGIHQNSRGAAWLAGVFIDAINAKFGASVPKPIMGRYTATGLPIP